MNKITVVFKRKKTPPAPTGSGCTDGAAAESTRPADWDHHNLHQPLGLILAGKVALKRHRGVISPSRCCLETTPPWHADNNSAQVIQVAKSMF